MFNLATAIYVKSIEFVDNTREKLGETLTDNYYINKRAVLHGLPISIITSVMVGYLFGTTDAMTSAVYGTISYGITATLIEIHGPISTDKYGTPNGNDNTYLAGLSIFSLGHIFSTAFIKTVLKTNASYLITIPLLLGPLAGAITRSLIWDNEEEFFNSKI